MANGFWIGLGIGFVTAWFFYWRVTRIFFRLAFGKESLRRDVFSKFSWEALTKTQEQLDAEMARRRP